jgi:hypothetical protein
LLLDLDHAASARPSMTGKRMPKFQPAAAHAPGPMPLTENRQALLDLNAARSAAMTEVEGLQARMGNLAKLRGAVPPLEAELAALDAKEAAALAEWSTTPDEPAPEPDVATRADILARLTAARQRVASAELATASVEHVLSNAAQKAAGIERQVPSAVANVLIDEAHDILPAIVEATAALAKAQIRFTALRSFLLDRAEVSRDDSMRYGVFAALEKLDIAARHAAGNAPPPDFNATLEWRELADALGDTPARPTQPPIAAFAGMPELDRW